MKILDPVTGHKSERYVLEHLRLYSIHSHAQLGLLWIFSPLSKYVKSGDQITLAIINVVDCQRSIVRLCVWMM